MSAPHRHTKRLPKREQRIYCKYCGAKLRRDPVGPLCPTKNCQWEHGAVFDDSPRRALEALRLLDGTDAKTL